MKLKWLQTPSCRSRRTASRKAAARSIRAARSAAVALFISRRLPMRGIIETERGAARAPLRDAELPSSAVLALLVLAAGLSAEDRRAHRAAEGPSVAADWTSRAD